jgi:hypothetical protein
MAHQGVEFNLQSLPDVYTNFGREGSVRLNVGRMLLSVSAYSSSFTFATIYHFTAF